MSKKNLVIEESEAKKLYKTAGKDFKQILENTFGKEFFIEKITDKIKTWEDVVNYWYEVKGININVGIPYQNLESSFFKSDKQQKSLNALYKIQWISKTLNEDWNPNFNNFSQHKYYPYFEKSSGGGWLVYSYSIWAASSDLGFGLYFKSKELALFAGNTFIDIYREYLPE